MRVDPTKVVDHKSHPVQRSLAHPEQVVVEPLVEPLHGEEAVPAVEGGRRAVRVVLHADRVVEAHHDGRRAALPRAVGRRADRRGPEMHGEGCRNRL